MIEAMPHDHFPYLQREVTRHGTVNYYVRKDRHQKRIRIRGVYNSPEFKAAYEAAMRGDDPVSKRQTEFRGTLAWALKLYRESADWAALSQPTRKQRENIFKHIIATAGNQKLSAITKAKIVEGRDRRKATPNAARHFVEAMRKFYKWAVPAEIADFDPTAGVKSPKIATDGHLPWNDDDVAAFEKRWKIGTRERVAFDILLYTGLRRGDATMLGRQHVKNGVLRLNTEKTGERVTISMAPELQASLAAGPCGEVTFIATGKRQRMTKESFGNWFREACISAGVEKSAHGLRKTAATRMANNGASEKELDAVFGWKGGRMASLYTRNADRERIALAAAEKLHRRLDKTGTDVP